MIFKIENLWILFITFYSKRTVVLFIPLDEKGALLVRNHVFEGTLRTGIGLSVEGHFSYIVMENQRALHIFPIIITVYRATNIAKG